MTQINYRPCGDYLIPDLKLPEQNPKTLGKYGRMRERYLKEHRKGLYSCLMLSGKLSDHLYETDAAAKDQMNILIPLMAEKAGVTEKLKEADPMAWVQMMNGLKAQAEEIVLQELVYN